MGYVSFREGKGPRVFWTVAQHGDFGQGPRAPLDCHGPRLKPDIYHCMDYHAALAPLYLEDMTRGKG